MSDKQKEAIITLLWDYLTIDREHNNRVLTGWGNKTQQGLIACIETIFKMEVK